MVQHVLVGPVGFQEWKTRDVFSSMEFDKLVLLRTSHPKARQHVRSARRELASRGIGVEEVEVRPAFSFVAWYRALSDVADRFGRDDITMNITAGHGVAISMAAMVAAQRSLPCVCFDVVEAELHHASPSILLGMQRLVDTDRRILEALRKRAATVTEIQSLTRDKISTVSMALQRLREDGWLVSQREGQSIRYSLRPGVRSFIPDLL